MLNVLVESSVTFRVLLILENKNGNYLARPSQEGEFEGFSC